ncbi:GTP 3',8-cyclase MoaA [Candidatus Poseidoniales archaeon]|nr:GTP 3',8-cyclase MoaA [Candidatus Poseidoniales archaeon]
MVLKDVFKRPLLDLRISVTDRCNMRCRYCMPREHFDNNHVYLPKSDILSFEEIVHVVESLLPSGLRKVRLTGGEPLIRKDLHKLIQQLRALSPDLDIALTTNAHLLSNSIERLKEAGISRITVSLDAVDVDVYQSMGDTTSTPDMILESIDKTLAMDIPVKVNTVVQKGINEHQIIPLITQMSSRDVPIRFIEYMDVGATNSWNLDHVMTGKEMRGIIEKEFGTIQSIEPDHPSDVAREYTINSGSIIGFIESISNPFCGDCSRARLSANGSIFTCLFATKGFDIRGILRMDASKKEISEAIASIWSERKDRYSETRSERTDSERIEMSFIGG